MTVLFRWCCQRCGDRRARGGETVSSLHIIIVTLTDVGGVGTFGLPTDTEEGERFNVSAGDVHRADRIGDGRRSGHVMRTGMRAGAKVYRYPGSNRGPFATYSHQAIIPRRGVR